MDIAGTVTQLQLEIAFDDKVKEMALFKGEKHEDHLNKKERRAYFLIRRIVIIIFCVLVPFLQAPAWCVRYYH